MKSWFVVFIYIIVFSCRTYSQNNNLIGLDFQLDYQTKTIVDWNYATVKTYQAAVISSFGIVYERLFSKNDGIEVEVKYKSSPNQYTFYVPEGVNTTVQVNVPGKESFLSMPILFKYRTNLLNISLGPTVEYFLGWKQSMSKYFISNGVNTYPKYFFPDKFSLGLMFKISKSINVSNKCILEPGIFYNPILSYKNNYFGLSLIIKYPF